jgi:hypothetical protein
LIACFACGSKVLNDLFLPNFYPAGKNLEEKEGKVPLRKRLSGDRVTRVNEE